MMTCFEWRKRKKKLKKKDDMELVPLDQVLITVCEAVNRATVSNPATKAYGVAAISQNHRPAWSVNTARS